MKKIGLALSSGGARGIAQIPFIEVFEELNIKPYIISGSSIGAVTGSLFAAGVKTKKMLDFLKNQNISDYTNINDFLSFSKKGLIKGDKITKTIKNLLKVENIEDLKIKTKIVASDFWRHKEFIFEKGNLSKAIRASISIPGILEPVVEKESVLTDGGSINPLPYDIIREECDILIAIDTSTNVKENFKKTKLPSIITNVLDTFDILQNKIIEEKMNRIKPEIYIKPIQKDTGILEFHKYKDILSQAYESKNLFKKELENLLNTKI